jgi:hypothetical protein
MKTKKIKLGISPQLENFHFFPKFLLFYKFAMDQTIRTSIAKLGNWKKLSIRRRVERFNNRQEGDDERFHLDLFPLEKSVTFYVDPIYDDDDDDDTTYMHPWLSVDETVNDFKCKIWLENLGGEKCPEISCKSRFI